jgi:membrane protein DedA with SNARE-associated domain
MPWDKLPYLCVLAALLAASLGVPLPEDIPLLTGGYLCHRGLAELPIMIAVGMAGVLTGDFVLFSLGRRFGHHIVEHRVVRRIIKPSRLLLAERLFERHGIKIVFIGRFLPGLRGMIFMATGVMKVPRWKFAAVNGFAACISVPTLVILGKIFGANFDQLKSDVRMVTNLIGLVVLVVAVAVIALYWHRRQKQLLAEAGPVEPIDAETLAHLPPGGHVEHSHAGSPPEPNPPGSAAKPGATRKNSSCPSPGRPANATTGA